MHWNGKLFMRSGECYFDGLWWNKHTNITMELRNKKGINTKITLKWAHKQFDMAAHATLYLRTLTSMQVTEPWISNRIPQNAVGAISYPCLKYLLVAQHAFLHDTVSPQITHTLHRLRVARTRLTFSWWRDHRSHDALRHPTIAGAWEVMSNAFNMAILFTVIFMAGRVRNKSGKSTGQYPSIESVFSVY